MNDVWSRLDYENNATYSGQHGAGTPEIVGEGDATKLKPTTFKTYGLGNTPPFKGPTFGHYGTTPDRLRLRLNDDRLRFFLEPSGDPQGNDPLVTVLDEWLGSAAPVSVLDFSGVPTEATDLAIGAVLQLLFEVAVRSETDGIGRPRPVLIVLEEAHRYLNEKTPSVRLAMTAVNRIAREGRKYGIGLLLVTQRPSELPATALAQVGTIIALRLTNSNDQGVVKSALPDSIAGLADSLPALRTGEALISGEAITIPTRVAIDPPSPWPSAADPQLSSWRKQPSQPNDLSGAVERWRKAQGGSK